VVLGLWLRLAGTLCAGGSLVSGLFAASAAKRPDILVFLADDLGKLDSTPYGGAGIRTPHMQSLADAGVTFDRAYVTSPSCAPSRASLLTGMFPARNGAEANHTKPHAHLKKWPAYFHELGYEVVAFGKVAHYRYTADYGFDYFAHDTFHDHAAIPAAVEFLQKRPRDSAKPLCFMVGSNWPHVPWPELAGSTAYDPQKLPLPVGGIDTPATRQWRARYASAVSRADDDLGTVLAAVREHLSSDTLILFSSDHGAQWPFGKWNLYEYGTTVPLMVVWPGHIKPGWRGAAMVQWTDFLPTLLEAAGGRPPADIEGRSFLPVLRGETPRHRDRIFTTHSGDGRMNVYPARALRDERWKYIRNLHPEYAFTTHLDLVAGRRGQRAFYREWEAAAKTDATAAAIVQRYHARPAEELYDLAAEPFEQRNLAADPAHAATLARMRAALDAELKAQSDPLKTFAEPRLLSDPTAWGPRAEIDGDAQPAAKKGKKKQ
jgi:arylsulfatase A-like enzyme